MTSPEPVTVTFTTPPPALPSMVASSSARCAASMSACIFCICFIIWFTCFWFATGSSCRCGECDGKVCARDACDRAALSRG